MSRSNLYSVHYGSLNTSSIHPTGSGKRSSCGVNLLTYGSSMIGNITGVEQLVPVVSPPLFPLHQMLLDQRRFPEIELKLVLPTLYTPRCQEAAYTLIGPLCRGCGENLEFVVRLVKKLIYWSEGKKVLGELPPIILERLEGGFVGLKNGGATCYMNSVLQQIYMIPQVHLFTFDLCYVGRGLPRPLSPSHISPSDQITPSIVTVVGYTRIEPFLMVPVDVRNHGNLIDSLDEFVKGDLLEGNNAYYCEICDKKVDTVKRLCFQKLPNVLAIQLKRFGYDWERECAVKYNDYFEFPDTLSMERYTVDYLQRIEETEPHQMIESGDRQDAAEPSHHSSYRLVGVVVRSGKASGGHYYSYIKQRQEEGSGEKGQWYRRARWLSCVSGHLLQLFTVNMGLATQNINHPFISRWNAYILFYERDQGGGVGESNPVYNPPSSLVRQVRQENLEFLHHRSLYSVEFSHFIRHLVLPNMSLLNNTPDCEQIALECLDVLSTYLFQLVVLGYQGNHSYHGYHGWLPRW
eukprot:sb/3479771/